MAKFDNENQGNFGIPGVSIEPSLSSDFDPYYGRYSDSVIRPKNYSLSLRRYF